MRVPTERTSAFSADQVPSVTLEDRDDGLTLVVKWFADLDLGPPDFDIAVVLTTEFEDAAVGDRVVGSINE